jgi:queuine tRNA-ribosyltransferase
MLDRVSGEVMHPIGGPLDEAERLHVGPSRLAERLSSPGPGPVVVLDVGLGAGSNAAAALHLRESLSDQHRPLAIVSLERSLAAFALALEPEHAAVFGWNPVTLPLASALLRHGAVATSRVDWRLCHADILEALPREPAASVDVVFWDPFSPRANPELWTLGAFRLLRHVCRRGASVHTYSGATSVRSALLLAGFCVGIGAKIAEGKHATIAALDPFQLAQPLDRRWFERLARSSAPFPPDAPPEALERVRASPQFAF